MSTEYAKMLDTLKFLLKSTDSNILTNEDIDQAIEKLKSMIAIGVVGGINELDDATKINLKKDIEMQYNVQMDECSVLKGSEQRTKDNEWWNRRKKTLEGDFSYWVHYMDTLAKLPPKVIRTIDTDTDTIMNNLFDPITENQFESRYGMVMGHVQSGKTSNYAGLICKAIDAGYKFIVIIAGIHDNLRNQTQKRIANIFKKVPMGKQPVILTSEDHDFQKSSPQKFSTLNFSNTSSPVFIVIKKNKTVLDAVLKWASQDSSVPMLVIDDEADNATINTRDENNPTAINLGIRKLLKKFNKHSYVAYTATPFANIFIDDEAGDEENGPDLFPKDFIIVLKAPSDYLGAVKIFLEDRDNFCSSKLISIDEIEGIEKPSGYLAFKGKEDECLFEIPRNHKKDFQPSVLPQSLLLAIRMFFINIAIRNLRHQENEHNSMLVHASRFTGVHAAIAHLINGYISKIRTEIRLYGKRNYPEGSIISSIKNDFNTYYNHIEETWNDVLNELNVIYDKVDVMEAHCNSKERIEYSNEHQTNIIAVGGNSLSRGFTLEGLSVSYFLRNAGASDTLMQMGRWFGYRNKYEDICKIFMPEDIIEKFEYVADSSSELYALVDDMNKYQKTPREFGLSVRMHPESFLITARNKMKNAQQYTVQVGLDGTTKETSRIPRNKSKIEKNINAIGKFISEIDNNFSKIIRDTKGTKYLWLDIPSQYILEFLNNSEFLQSYMHFPIDDIINYLTDYSNDKWRVAFIGTDTNEKVTIGGITTGVQKRKVSITEENGVAAYLLAKNRQVTAGIAEKWGLTLNEFTELEKEKSLHREKITRADIRRKLSEPLMIIHIIRSNDEYSDIPDKVLPALSFTFPSLKEDRQPKTVKRMLNSVAIKQLQEELENQLREEEETDDE